jgi:UDP-N-acetylmuramate: L-alanyl-gamma-D-glutamyl-meso-diaminopimelate ligase
MPDIAILNGIAWDHMNVFPMFENYVDQFRIFIGKITEGGCLIYFDDDPQVRKLALESDRNIRKIPYKVHGYFQNKTGVYAATHNRVVPVRFFGEHNMQNLSAAKEACLAAGIPEDDFYKAIPSFASTSTRLQKLNENEHGVVWFDFAHSPSKVKATVKAVAARYPGREIVACLELHTYSSLNIEFLPLYRGTLDKASFSFVYFNPHAIQLKKLPSLRAEDVKKAFGEENISVYDNSNEMFSFIQQQNYRDPVYLFMSSGDFDGCNLKELSENLLLIK